MFTWPLVGQCPTQSGLIIFKPKIKQKQTKQTLYSSAEVYKRTREYSTTHMQFLAARSLCTIFSFARYSIPLEICKHIPSRCVCASEIWRTVNFNL